MSIVIKERPILFSAPMVRALLDGRKTQTRRVIKPQPISQGMMSFGEAWKWNEGGKGWFSGVTAEQIANPNYGLIKSLPCPYGKPGDRLWVRETFYAYGYWSKHFSGELGRDVWCFNDKTIESGYQHQFGEMQAVLKRTSGLRGWYKRPGIFIPRDVSRITLEITGVRVQRVQEISEEDALAEGCEAYEVTQQDLDDMAISDADPQVKELARILGLGRFPACGEFQMLWNSINGAGSWDAKTNAPFPSMVVVFAREMEGQK